MKRIFLSYTESEEQITFNDGQMIIPALKSSAIEFSNPQHIETLLPLFSLFGKNFEKEEKAYE